MVTSIVLTITLVLVHENSVFSSTDIINFLFFFCILKSQSPGPPWSYKNRKKKKTTYVLLVPFRYWWYFSFKKNIKIYYCYKIIFRSSFSYCPFFSILNCHSHGLDGNMKNGQMQITSS